MSNKNSSGSIKRYLEPFLKKVAEGYFGPRARFNREDKTYIFQDIDFENDIREARIDLHIPKLNLDDDFILMPVNEEDEEYDSVWVNKIPKDQFDGFNKKIKWLLHKYNLPLNFRSSIEIYLMYRKKPKTTPLYNSGLLSQVLANPEELKRMPLTTQEKKLIKDYLRYQNGKDQNLQSEFDKLLQGLAQSKNKRRQMRTFNSAMKASKKKRRHKYHDYTKGKDVEPIYTFLDLAENLAKTEITDKQARQKAATLRKQKQRLKERHNTSQTSKN